MLRKAIRLLQIPNEGGEQGYGQYGESFLLKNMFLYSSISFRAFWYPLFYF